MRIKTLYYRPHKTGRSFTAATRGDGQVEVREWDMVTSSLAEEVMIVALSSRAYAHTIASCQGNEREAQRKVVAEARRRVQHGILSRLTHQMLVRSELTGQ